LQTFLSVIFDRMHTKFLWTPIVAYRTCWRVLPLGVLFAIAWATVSPPVNAATILPLLPRFVSVATNTLQAAAVDTDGRLWAWGTNYYGPFGDGPDANKTLPTRVAGEGFAQVYLVRDTGFAIKTDGSLWAWGDNSRGKFGDGTTDRSAVPKQVGSGFTRLAGGFAHAVGLKGDGSLWTWGRNSNGELGDDTPAAGRSRPQQIGSGFVDIAEGYAIKADGSLWAWGDVRGGFSGFDATTRLTRPTQIATGFVAIAQQDSHSLALKQDGSLWAWGFNHAGQLGDGTTTDSLIAKQIGSGFSAIWAGAAASAAIRVDGSLWTWGARPTFLSPGTPGENQRLTPEQVGTGFASLGSGGQDASTAVAIKTDGSLWAWSSRKDANLGDDFGLAQRPLTIKEVGRGFVGMAGGQLHSVAVQTDGSLWAWGFNASGQVGNGTAFAVPAMVQIGSDFKAVAAGGAYPYPAPLEGFSLGLKKDGSVWAWGSNSRGQLGNGSLVNALAPQQIATGFSAVATGRQHAVALKPDGTVWSWGANDLGQLGDKTTVDRSQPVRSAFDFLTLGPSYSAIAAGGDHTLALRPDGSLWAWGNNSSGQLGNGSTMFRNSAVLVGDGYKAMAAGKAHSLGLKTDGTLWAWGQNSAYGQLGDGGTDDVLRPKPIMDGVVAVAAGETHSLALKVDGTVWAWGAVYDYLGFCTDLCSNFLQYNKTPKQIGAGYTAIAAGANHALALKANGSLWAWGAPGGSQPNFSAVPKPVDFAKVFTRQTQSECLFDWAAIVAPTLFAPAGAASVDVSTGRYRHYAGTQSYLAVTHETRRVLYLDASTPGPLADLGEAANWVSTAGCE
jgi:alpha-tubulin suppressor-like RCC1 family protein